MSKTIPPPPYNPFTETNITSHFVGREDELRTFRLAIQGLRVKQPGHLYVAGLGGTGKTCFLQKVVEIGRAEGFLAEITTLDQGRARDHISTILRSLVNTVEQAMNRKGNQSDVKLLQDWDNGAKSTHFQHPRGERLESDKLRQDFETLRKLMEEAGVTGAVLCVDEGQRIEPAALSALKNALQHHQSFLVVLSLRLVSGTGGPVRAGRAWLEEKVTSVSAEGDIGASRFYVTGVPMGPFGTVQEAKDCIQRRLQENAIQFDDDVAERISYITGRVPGDMINLASSVYKRAANDGITRVTVADLNEIFRSVHRAELQQASTLYGQLSTLARDALRGLLVLRGPVTAGEIVIYLYPMAALETHPTLVAGVSGELKRICGLSTFCEEADERYAVIKPLQAYALELISRTAANS